MYRKLIFKLVLLINVGLLAGQLFITCTQATGGQRLGDLDRQLRILTTEKNLLEAEIFSYSSISSVLSRALESGMQPGNPSYLTAPAVAVAPSLSDQSDRQ